MLKRSLLYLAAAAVFLVTLSLYATSFQHEFINWDDDLYVVDNPHIRSFGLSFIVWATTNLRAGSWIPVTWGSFALDHAAWGLDPRGFHLTNGLLHAVNAVLVVYLVVRLLETARELGRRQGMPLLLDDRAVVIAAGTTGMLFGVHPVHVESVAWVAERKDLLCALFMLLSINAYLRYVSQRGSSGTPAGARAPGSRRSYLLALLFAVLALASKPMAVSLPLIFLLLDWFTFRRFGTPGKWTALIVEKIPFLALCIAVSIITIIGQKSAGYLSPVELARFPARVLVAFHAIAAYLGNMALPLRLVPLYPYPNARELLSFSYLFSAVLVIGITVFCILIARKQPAWTSLWGYYLITLAPVLGLVQVGEQSMADRYTYLPSIAPFLCLGLGAAQLSVRIASAARLRSLLATLAIVLSAALCVALSLLTLKQIAIWKNGVVLWSYVIEQEPGRLPIAYNNRGLSFKALKQLDLAREDISMAIRLDPSFAKYYVNRGSVLGEAGSLEPALEDFSRAIALDAGYADAYTGRGLVLVEQGRAGRALEDLDRAVRLDPTRVEAFLNRGVAHERMGRDDLAIDDYGRATELDPYDYLAHVNRGMAFGRMGRSAEAVEELTRAIALKRDAPQAYVERGNLHRAMGRPELALADYQKGCDLGSTASCEAARAAPFPDE
jgi:protein O-mannosyl-transferase